MDVETAEERQQHVSFVLVPNLLGLTPDGAADVAEVAGLHLSNGRVGGYGRVSSQSPRSGSRVRAGSYLSVAVTYGGASAGSGSGSADKAVLCTTRV